MTDTPNPETDTVVIGDLSPPTSPPQLRLVTGDDTPPVARVKPLTPEPPARRHTRMQWLSLVMTLAALGVLSLTIVLFDPPTYLAGAALAVVVVIGALLVCAEVITERANRRQPYGDMTVGRRRNENGVLAGGFDVHTLDLGD